MHRAIVEQILDERPNVLRDGRAIITAGPPGAGKSSALAALVVEHERHLWRDLDPDHVKVLLLRAEIKAGTIESIYPLELRNGAFVEWGLAPGELAALVHEESSMIAGQVRRIAIARNERVLIDGLHGDAGKLEDRLKVLQARGYGSRSTTLLAVDGSWHVTRARVEHRTMQSYAAFVAGQNDGVEIRYVPESVTDSVFESRDAQHSLCRAATRAVMTTVVAADIVDSAQVYDVPSPASAPRLVLTYQRDTRGRIRTLRARDEPLAATPSAGPSGDDGGEGTTHTWVDAYTRADGVHVEGHFRQLRRGAGRLR